MPTGVVLVALLWMLDECMVRQKPLSRRDIDGIPKLPADARALR